MPAAAGVPVARWQVALLGLLLVFGGGGFFDSAAAQTQDDDLPTPTNETQLPEFVSEAFAERLTAESGGRTGAAIAYAGNFSLVGQPTVEFSRGVVRAYMTDRANWTLSVELRAPDAQDNDWFGSAAALHGLYALVGASQKDAQAGAVYAYHRDSFIHGRLELQHRVSLPSVQSGDECGSTLALVDAVGFVGCPNDDTLFDNGGVVRVISLDAASQTWSQLAVIQAAEAAPGLHFGEALAVARSQVPGNPSIGRYMVLIGAPQAWRFGVQSGAAWVFNSSESNVGSWSQLQLLDVPDPTVRMQFGFSVEIDMSWREQIVVGAPREYRDAIQGGAAYVFVYNNATDDFDMHQKLYPSERANSDNFGQSVGIRDNITMVCAPGSDPFIQSSTVSDAGACFFYLHDHLEDIFIERSKVIAVDAAIEVQFGDVAILREDGALIGAPARDAFEGGVYTFNGADIWAIRPATLDPDSGSYLIGQPLRILVTTYSPLEEVFYTIDGTDANPVTSPSLPADDYITLALVEGPVVVKHIVRLRRLGRSSFSPVVTDVYRLWVVDPGRYWIPHKRVLVACGASQFYCPGVFEDPNRYNVTYGYYSTPLAAQLDRRSGQSPCEPDVYCERGIRVYCGLAYCWPEPAQISAREAYDPSQRQPGLGSGDVLVIRFNNNTNMIPVPSTEEVLQLLHFSETLGDALEGEWVNETTLEVTIVDDVHVGDPWKTRVNTLTLEVDPAGELRKQHNFTQPSDTRGRPSMLIGGSWGDHHTPYLVRAEAQYSRNHNTDEYGAGPGSNDSLVIEWDSLIDWSVPVSSQQDIDNLIEFVPPIVDSNYTGRWISWTEMEISFGPIFGHNPDLKLPISRIRQQYSVGSFIVQMRLPSHMRSRDRSSPYVTTPTPVVLSGSWGDVPADTYLTFSSDTALNVYWASPDSNPSYTTSQYRVQLSSSAHFGSDAIVVDDVVPAQAHLETRPVVWGHGYNRSYSVAPGRRYWARVALFHDGQWGVFASTRPRSLLAQQPEIKERLTKDRVITQGELVTFRINDLGRGPMAEAPLQLLGAYDNFATRPSGFTRSYAAKSCWLEPTDGSILYCMMSPGVGRDYQWNLTARGVTSDMSGSEVVVHYRRPIVFEFDDKTAGVVDALSSGGQRVRFEGANFGTIAADAIAVVNYWPNMFPDTIFTAQLCNITVDHHEIHCFTGIGGGEDLRWGVNIEGQVSDVVSTSYAGPLIHSVSKLSGGMSLLSDGGEVVEITGVNFGENRSDIDVIVRYVGAVPRPGGIHPGAQDDGQDLSETFLFFGEDCHVVETHIRVHCTTAPGFAVEPLLWSVEILGQISAQFPTGLHYDSPSLQNISTAPGSPSTPTSGNTRTLWGSSMAAEHPDMVQVLFREVDQDGNYYHLSHSAISFQVPEGTGAFNSLAVVVNHVRSVTVSFAYRQPFIERLELKWQSQDQLPAEAQQQGVTAATWKQGVLGEVALDFSGTSAKSNWPWFQVESQCLQIEVHGRDFGIHADRALVTIQSPQELGTCALLSDPAIDHLQAVCCTQMRRGNMSVLVDGQVSPVFQYDVDALVPTLELDAVVPPMVDSFGQVLTLVGRNFLSGGPPVGGVVVRRLAEPHFEGIRSTVAAPGIECRVLTFSDEQVTCLLPPTDSRFEPNVTISVHVYSYASQKNLSSNALVLSYSEPHISHIRPISLPQRGGIIELWGSSFGHWGEANMGRVQLARDGEGVLHECYPLLSWNHTHIACVVPEHAGNTTVRVDVPWTTSISYGHTLEQTVDMVFSGASKQHRFPWNALAVGVAVPLVWSWLSET